MINIRFFIMIFVFLASFNVYAGEISHEDAQEYFSIKQVYKLSVDPLDFPAIIDIKKTITNFIDGKMLGYYLEKMIIVIGSQEDYEPLFGYETEYEKKWEYVDKEFVRYDNYDEWEIKLLFNLVMKEGSDKVLRCVFVEKKDSDYSFNEGVCK